MKPETHQNKGEVQQNHIFMLFSQNTNNRLQDFFFQSKMGCVKKYKKTKTCLEQKKQSSQRRTHQLVIQCQGVRGENISTSNIIQTENNTFKNIYSYTYAYTYVTKINEKNSPRF